MANVSAAWLAAAPARLRSLQRQRPEILSHTVGQDLDSAGARVPSAYRA